MDARRQRVREIIIQTLREACDFDLGKVVPDSAKPFSDLGLESVDGILIAPRLCAKLGINIPPEVNPLIDDERECKRTVGELVDFMLTMMPAEETSHVKK